MTTKTRIDRLEKELQKQQDAAMQEYFAWARQNQTPREDAAWNRYFLAVEDDPDKRGLWVDALQAAGEPLEFREEEDNATILAFFERVPPALQARLRAVGAWTH